MLKCYIVILMGWFFDEPIAPSDELHPLIDQALWPLPPNWLATSNQDVYKAMLGLIRSARNEIIIHTCYIARCRGENSKDTFIDELLTFLDGCSQYKGIHVTIVVDTFGAWWTGSGGPQMRTKYPYIHWYVTGSGQLYNQNYHRKFIVVDRKRALVLSGNISHEYFGTKNPRFLDTAMYTTDPVIITDLISDGKSNMDCGQLFKRVVGSVNHNLVILSGSFDPTSSTIDMLIRLCQRGVRVHIYCMKHWGYADLGRNKLSEAGVTIMEMPPGMPDFHAKVWVIDADLKCLGSNDNIDIRLVKTSSYWMGSCNISVRSFEMDRELMVQCNDIETARGLLLAYTTSEATMYVPTLLHTIPGLRDLVNMFETGVM